MLMNFAVVFLLCLSVACETCNESPLCSLFPNQDRGIVTVQDLTQKVQSKSWIEIYYTDFSSTQSYGKCNFKWDPPDANQNVNRAVSCYNFDFKNCELFPSLVKQKVSDCGRAEENSTLNETMDAKFYSQDVDKYFWYYACYEYDTDNRCTTAYVDLIVNKVLYTDAESNELDLKGLPWHLVTSDLKLHFNMTMSDVRLYFSWKGPECGLDGNIIETNRTSQNRFDIVVLSFIVVLLILY